MAITRSKGKAKAVKPAAPKKQKAKSNGKVAKANGKAKTVEPVAAKKRQAQSDDSAGTADCATPTMSTDNTEVEEIVKAAKHKPEEERSQADIGTTQALITAKGVEQAKERPAPEKLQTMKRATRTISAIIAAEALANQGPKSFLDRLPTETIQHIGDFLDDGSAKGDKDLNSLAMTCRQTYNAICHCEFGVWIKRFAKRFELVPGYTKPELIEEYKYRQLILRKVTKVVTGRCKKEMKVVSLLKKLILESFKSKAKSKEKPYSKNLDKVWEIVQRSKILDHLHRFVTFDTTSNAHNNMQFFSMTKVDVQVLQLVLAHMFLRPVAPQPYGIEYSQMAVYGHPRDYPIFMRRRLSLEFLLFILNFFQYHLSNKGQGTLQHLVETLDLGSPKAWDSELKNGLTKLGRKWNGARASMADPFTTVPLIRECAPGYSVDAFPDTITATTLELDFEKRLPVWPDIFQESLASIPPRSTEKEAYQQGKNYLQFSSGSKNVSQDMITGVLHALPVQYDFPGFQRATWMAAPPSHRYTDETELMEDAINQIAVMDITGDITAYEGIVLPGGKIMVGRWWNPKDTPEEELEGGLNSYYKQERCDIGPFILWAVDEEEEEKTKTQG